MKTAARTAQLMASLVTVEAELKDATRTARRAERAADRAAARVKTARVKLTEARRDERAAERAGKGLAAAARKVAHRTAKLAELTAAARTARTEATAARRAAKAAERRFNRLALRAAISAGRTVEKIAQRIGETRLSAAPAEDKTLSADELPAVEEIEAHGARYADLDAKAKAFAKAADAEKTWLRQLPTGIYGRVIITRTPGRSIQDTRQIELDYVTRFRTTAPRKSTRSIFKADASALLPAQAELFVSAA